MTLNAKALVLLGSLLASAPLAGQTPPRLHTPCTAPEYRQFDFWVGDWDVLDAKGNPAGTNTITREMEGCVLQEHWVAAGTPAQTGSSFNTWSPALRKWHQTWVDSTGGFLLLQGGIEGGAMILGGELPGRDGTRVRHRISWSRPDPGKDDVRQLWESSRDEGKTWNVAFDGRYVRRKSPSAPPRD